MTLPFSLEDALRLLAQRGLLAHLSVVETNDGRWQASVKRPGDRGYIVVVQADIVEAIWKAMGPPYGKSWSDLLGEVNEEDDEDLEDLIG